MHVRWKHHPRIAYSLHVHIIYLVCRSNPGTPIQLSLIPQCPIVFSTQSSQTSRQGAAREDYCQLGPTRDSGRKADSKMPASWAVTSIFRGKPAPRERKQQTKWRRGWDLNPRLSFPNTRFPSVLLKPLGHLSTGRKAQQD